MSVALVTGGSRGIGRAIVEEFAGAGYSVAFTYSRNRDAAMEVVAGLEEKGRRVIPHQADVRDFPRAQEVIEESESTLGPLDVLINNAGIRLDGALHKMDPGDWSAVIDTNLTGTFNYARALIPKMIRRGGSIININGNSGFVVGERGFGPATALDTVDAPILKPSAFGRGWDLGACVNGGVEGRAGDAPLPPKWLITMGLRQKNRFNECKACGCEPASNHMSGFGFSATDSDSGRRAHGSHERARSARKGRKKHVSVLPRPNRSPWIVVEQNHNGIGKLMVPAFQIYANMNVINDL